MQWLNKPFLLHSPVSSCPKHFSSSSRVHQSTLDFSSSLLSPGTLHCSRQFNTHPQSGPLWAKRAIRRPFAWSADAAAPDTAAPFAGQQGAGSLGTPQSPGGERSCEGRRCHQLRRAACSQNRGPRSLAHRCTQIPAPPAPACPLRASLRAWRRLAPPWSWSALGGGSAQQVLALAKSGESGAPPLKHHTVRHARG